MKKYILCLANSKKYHGRCVAGIEMTPIDGGYSPVLEDGEPKWLRPVSSEAAGAVPTRSVEQLRLLDIFEVEATGSVPDGFHTEDITYQEGSIRSIRRGNVSAHNYSDLLSRRDEDLFGSAGKELTVEQGNHCNHSILMIEPTEFEAFFDGDGDVRANFAYRDKQYRNVKVTDPEFELQFRNDNEFYRHFEHTLLTISVTILFDKTNSYWKLVAGVVNL